MLAAWTDMAWEFLLIECEFEYGMPCILYPTLEDSAAASIKVIHFLVARY